MSRAFVKEADNQAPDLPDRPVSPHRNFVTPEGLAAIEGLSFASRRPAGLRSTPAISRLRHPL
jgi:transcription elongation factor GreB